MDVTKMNAVQEELQTAITKAVEDLTELAIRGGFTPDRARDGASELVGEWLHHANL